MTTTLDRPAREPLRAEVATGWAHTRLLLTWRWRAFRAPTLRAWILVGAAIIAVGLLLAANLGYAIRLMAASPEQSAATTFASLWIMSLQRNELGDIGALTVGGAVVAAIFAPFTGSSTLALAPVEDLFGVRLARLHRYFDALLINCVSGIGLLQLLALTGITSVLTLDGSRGPAMLVTWGVWALVIVLTTTTGWILEWIVRRWGTAMRRIVAGILLVAVGAAVYLDPWHGKTLFGLGSTYARVLRSAAAGDYSALLVPTVSLLVLGAVMLIAGFAATRAALALPAVVGHTARTRRPLPTPAKPWRLAVLTLLTTLWRTPECRRPIAAVVIVGVPGVAFVDMTGNLESAVMLAVPLAISLAWGVNLFAVFGPAMTWLTAQPALLRRLPWIAVALQTILTYLLILLLALTSYLTGHADSGALGRLAVGGLVAAVLSSALSIGLSVNHPIRARLSGRGDALIPPLTALAYLMRLMFLACMPAAIVAVLSPTSQAAAVAAAILIAVALTARAAARWADPTIRSHVVATVAST